MANVIPIAIAVALGQKWPLATEKLGAKSYIILLVLSASGFAMNWWFVVEPKGLSIEHIDSVSSHFLLAVAYMLTCESSCLVTVIV